MTELLEELDNLIESQQISEAKPEERKRLHAVKELIVNVDVARRLAEGESPRDLALELNVSEATIRKWMHKAPMIELMAIETRRILRHLPKRKLSKVSYKNLAETAIKMLDLQERARNGSMGPENRIINQTFIERIDLLIQRSGSKSQSIPDSRKITEITGEEIPELPEELDQDGTEPSGNPDVSGELE